VTDMILEGELGRLFQRIVMPHISHELAVDIVRRDSTLNIAVCCMDCNQVLIDYSPPDDAG
jgi:hypothetical protein